jgi:putative peptide zinc metalloprotease protein
MSIWETLKSRLDIAFSTPEAIKEIEISRLSSKREGAYYIIKNPAKLKYLKLSEKDHFIWSNLDGKNSIKDIVVKYYMEFGAFAFERVSGLIQELKDKFFLREQPIYLFQKLRTKLASQSLDTFLLKFKDLFFQKEVAISGIDCYLTFLYEKFVYLFYTKVAKVFYVLISVTGMGCFWKAYLEPQYQLLQTGHSVGLQMLTLLLIYAIGILIHESAHAFTTKSYGRSVPRGGFLFYYGSPAFFAETSDIWMERKGRRIAVTWAGPYSDIILGSICSIIIIIFPGLALNNFLYQVAFISFAGALVNLDPLLELDGYFLLMDWLEIPLLRKKSLYFIKADLLRKIEKKEVFSHEEKIFTVYGILCTLWTVVTVVLSIYMLKIRIESASHDLFSNSDAISKILSAGMLAAFIVPVALSLFAITYLMGKKGLVWLRHLSLWENVRNIAMALLVLSFAVCIVPLIFSLNNPSLYYRLVSSVALTTAVAYSLKSFVYQKDMRFSFARFFAFFTLLLLCSSLFSLAQTSSMNLGATLTAVQIIFDISAYGLLGLLTFSILARFINMKLKKPEVILLASAIPVTALVIFFLHLSGIASSHHYFTAAVSSLAIFVFVPPVISYYRTNFFLLYVFIVAAIALSLLSFFLEDARLIPAQGINAFAVLLLACGAVLYDANHKRFNFSWAEAADPRHLQEKDLLHLALKMFIGNIINDFGDKYGRRRVKDLEEKFIAFFREKYNTMSMQDDLSRTDDPSIIDLAARLTKITNFIGEYIFGVAGRHYTETVFMRAYDHMYWQERELADQYVIREVALLKDRLHYKAGIIIDRAQLIANLSLFSDMGKKERELLVPLFRAENRHSGDYIIRQGESGDRFYIISYGKASVIVKDDYGSERVVASLGPGDFLGQVALLNDTPRNATVKADTALELLFLVRKDFDNLVGTHPSIKDALLENEAFASFIKRIPLFSELPLTQVNFIAGRMYSLKYNTGETIINQGDVGNTFYVIKEGHFSVQVKSETGEEKIVGRLGPGEYFGEIALLLDVPRTATVRATTPGELFALDKAHFDRLRGTSRYAQRILEMMSSRRMHEIRSMD